MSALLQSHHQRMLIESGIDYHVAEARGYFSADEVAVAQLGFDAYQCRPGLVIPNFGVDGQFKAYELRPDNPRTNKKGEVIKYDRIAGLGNYLDVHPWFGDKVRSPNQTIVITEGSKKVDALASQGIPAIGLKGVWGWRGTNQFGAKGLIADFEEVAIRDNNFIILFDSDIKTNDSIQLSALRLQAMLISKRAKLVTIKELPYPGNEKRGVDDWIFTKLKDKHNE